MPKDLHKEEQLLLAEMQVLLAEFRTHLSLVRTGIGMLVGSVTLGFLLITNSAYLSENFVTFSSLIYCILLLVGLVGLYIFIRSEKKILSILSIIKEAEKKNKRIDKIMV